MKLGLIAGGYFLGSISPSYIYCKLFKGVDVRTIGDKNPGAANIALVFGSTPAFVIAFIDFCKGIIPVLIGKNLGFPLLWLIIAGLATVIGHDWSIFLNFKGGKGTLTSLGTLMILVPFETLIAFSLWLFVHYGLKTRFIGSIITFLLIPFLTLFISCGLIGEPKYLILFPIGILILFLVRMLQNIKNFFLQRGPIYTKNRV